MPSPIGSVEQIQISYYNIPNIHTHTRDIDILPSAAVVGAMLIVSGLLLYIYIYIHIHIICI